MHPRVIENRVAAVEQAQATVRIQLATWLRSPSKESRRRLEDSLIAVDDIFDNMLRPEKITTTNIEPRSVG